VVWRTEPPGEKKNRLNPKPQSLTPFFGTDWIAAPAPDTTTLGGAEDLTPRGFTDHEMLDGLGLVHMNGRIYDPLLGRFLSADIVIQAPGNLQSYNRYSYVFNNPLTMTDPTGYVGNYAMMGGAKYRYRGGALITPAQAKAGGKFVVDSYTEAFTEPFSILKSGLTGGTYLTPGERAQFVTFGTIALGAAVIEGTLDVMSGGVTKPAKSVARKGMREIAETVVERAAADVAGGGAESLTEASIKNELKDTPDTLFRTGSDTDAALTRPGGVSTRSSVSSSADGVQTFRPGEKVSAIDTSRLPEGSMNVADVPAGHVNLDNVSPDDVRNATIPKGPDNPLEQMGLKPLEDGDFYRIPRK
jgi:RHS repeat-associated protein